MKAPPSNAVGDRMDELPVTRGAWLPIDAAAELLHLEADMIRFWVADESLEVRKVEGIEFVRLAQLQSLAAG
jgi:hypothetical protein